jgi:hypothetical protein
MLNLKIISRVQKADYFIIPNIMKQDPNAAPGENKPGSSMIIRPHNLKELSALYGISARTLKKWLYPFKHEIGERVGYLYTVIQVKKIFELLGLPNVFYEERGGGRVGTVISLLSVLPTAW